MPSANQNAKRDTVAGLKSEFMKVQAAVVAHYTGIDVEKITNLRSQLRKNNIRVRVIKNTLAIRATEGTPLEGLKPSFKGPTALAYTETDAVLLAKTLTEFAATEEKLVIQSGVLNGSVLTKQQVEQLAKIPSREVLLARLAGALQSPYAGFVYTLSGVLRKFVYALDAVRRKKEEEGVK